MLRQVECDAWAGDNIRASANNAGCNEKHKIAGIGLRDFICGGALEARQFSEAGKAADGGGFRFAE